MQLWTIIGKEVYVEINPTGWDEYVGNKSQFDWWARHIKLVISHNKMPDKLQFWTRTFPDYWHVEKYDGRRLDLIHPLMWFDNQPGKYNMIHHPDPYMMV